MDRILLNSATRASARSISAASICAASGISTSPESGSEVGSPQSTSSAGEQGREIGGLAPVDLDHKPLAIKLRKVSSGSPYKSEWARRTRGASNQV